jgi:hypothetical protein
MPEYDEAMLNDVREALTAISTLCTSPHWRPDRSWKIEQLPRQALTRLGSLSS